MSTHWWADGSSRSSQSILVNVITAEQTTVNELNQADGEAKKIIIIWVYEHTRKLLWSKGGCYFLCDNITAKNGSATF